MPLFLAIREDPQSPRNGQKGTQEINLVPPMTKGGLQPVEVMLEFVRKDEKAFSGRTCTNGYRRTQRFEHHVYAPSLSLICLVNLNKPALQKKGDKIITAYRNVVVPGFTDHLHPGR